MWFFHNPGLLGINARNLLYIRAYNPKKAIMLADNKIKTKNFLSAREIPVAKLYASIHNKKELKHYRNDDNSTTIDKINRNVRFDDHSNIILKGKYINKDNYFNYRNFKGMLCGTGFIISQNLEVFKCWQTNRPDQAILDLNKQPPKYIRRLFLCMYNEDCCDGFEFPKYSIKHFVKHNKEITYG